jgi:serine/threonine protein kinase
MVVKWILYQTLLGIDFLHRNGVGHGDPSQSNLLFSVRDLTHRSLGPQVSGFISAAW